MTDTVLVVEDDPVIGSLLVKALETSGVGVLLAQTGDEALRLTEQIRPDAVLLDLNLPGAYGTEIATGLPDVPVIVVSALPNGTVAAAARAIGAFAYFTKPFDVFEVLSAVERAVAA